MRGGPAGEGADVETPTPNPISNKKATESIDCVVSAVGGFGSLWLGSCGVVLRRAVVSMAFFPRRGLALVWPFSCLSAAILRSGGPKTVANAQLPMRKSAEKTHLVRMLQARPYFRSRSAEAANVVGDGRKMQKCTRAFHLSRIVKFRRNAN